MRILGVNIRMPSRAAAGPEFAESSVTAEAPAIQSTIDRRRVVRASRMSPRRVAAFRAAEHDTVNHSWTKNPVPINALIADRLGVLRARSRDVGLNTDHGAAFLRLCRDNIVGAEGMQLRVMATFSGGDKLDEPANRATRDAWNEWCLEESCTMGRGAAMADLQRSAVTSLAEDGEAFFRIVTGRAAGKDWPIALHQLDAETCPVTHKANLANGRRVRLGIERDEWGRALAYYFYRDQPELYYNGYPTAGSLIRIPANEIIHLYVTERAGQARGVPWLAPAVQRIKLLSAYDEAAIVAARSGANKVGVITTQDGEGFAATRDQAALEEQDASGVMVIDAPDPGQWARLSAGETMMPWSPDYPRGEYSDFTAACLRGIAAGLGVGYQSLSMDRKGASYSSGRLEAQQERETWKALQGMFARKFCRRVYLEWLPIALMAKKIVTGAPLPIEREEKLRKHSWQGRRWEWVDPDGDMNAKASAVDLGITTVSEIIRETGRDPSEIFRERRQELNDYSDVLAVDSENKSTNSDRAVAAIGQLRRSMRRDGDQ
ncbi:MAG: phage portal protein [Gammaproteobacteria bacterium]|jgi:lambda family phage portal protein|nr:phage portal protein [Gammaproteobacteria bacterium]